MSEASPATLGDLQWARARWLVAALCEAGIRHLIFSPGSRSAPVALAARLDARLQAHAIIDERTAAFAALGMAREQPASVALLATSGSAPGHWLPAVMEASATSRGMLLISADRPASLHFRGANQTVEQRHLFSDFVDLQEDIDLAYATPECLRTCVGRVLNVLLKPAARPVHLNLRLHKPLEPSATAYAASFEALCDNAALAALAAGSHMPGVSPPIVMPGTSLDATSSDARTTEHAEHAPWELVGELVEALHTGPRRILVVGPLAPDLAVARAIVSLAERYGLPVWAHRTSNLGVGGIACSVQPVANPDDTSPSLNEAAAPAADSHTPPAIALHHGPEEPCASLEPPSHILTIGGAPVAGGLPPRWLKARPFIGSVALRQRADPDAQGTLHWLTRDLAASLHALAQPAQPARTHAQQAWLKAHKELARTPTKSANAHAPQRAPLTPAALYRGLGDLLPDGTRILIGNSLVIREVERYADDSWSKLTLYCQRGLSGIDGLVAGALGHYLAAPEVPLVLILGDVSFAHDCGALAALAQARGPILIVVLDNGGGRLFDRLPLAQAAHLTAHLDDFHTPPRLNILALAQAHNLEAHTITKLQAWHDTLRILTGITIPQLCIVAT